MDQPTPPQPPYSPASPKFPISPLRQRKIITLGESGVGKSSLVNKMMGADFNSKAQPTVGVDFLSQTVSKDGRSLRIQFWDTAGQERYSSLIPGYIRNARVALVVFDVTNPKGLETVDKWVHKVRACKGDETVIILAGNKVDLKDERAISEEAAQAKAASLGFSYTETSAKTGDNVQRLLETVVDAFDIAGESAPLGRSGLGTGDMLDQDNILVVDETDQRSCSLAGCCRMA